MTVFLQCLGSCNPRVRELDELVYRARSRYHEHGSQMLPLDAALLTELRSLRHTAHVGVMPDPYGPNVQRWECVACGHIRSWGQS